ncbi:MAG: aspartate/glutamate racemase family protein [Clostridia bacterium]|nr:aspartate/glutamate racemase family protein [Clostridia bacterium]
MQEKILGVLGGVGPLATVYFMDMLVKMTAAETDQEHIPVLCFNHATIPDRTAYILDNSRENPLPVMERDAQMLEKAGASYIVIPCNTAHYFYDQLQEKVRIPIINIINETVEYIRQKDPSVKKIGILATEGTIAARAYQNSCERSGVDYDTPNEFDQKSLMNIIYNQVKAGKPADFEEFMRIIGVMKHDGCDAVILGCTELSIIHRDFKMNRPDVVDSLQVLAKRSIEMCGRRVRDA